MAICVSSVVELLGCAQSHENEFVYHRVIVSQFRLFKEDMQY